MKILKAAVIKLLRKNDGIFFWMFRCSGLILRRLHREWDARTWSNVELRKWAPLFSGDIVNVSGWKDSDKAGNRYSDYFSNQRSYCVSNFEGNRGLAEDGGLTQISLDLARPIPQSLAGKFDCVFNHTVLEHVYDIDIALKNLCDLSKDAVIVVVPFLQCVHFDEGSYLDYWRVTPFALRKLFEENGFSVLYLSHNDNPVENVYLFCVATRNAAAWKARLPGELSNGSSDESRPGRSWAELGPASPSVETR